MLLFSSTLLLCQYRPALLLCSAGLLPLCSSYPALLFFFYAPTQPPISPRSMPIFCLALLLCSAGLLPLCPSSYPTLLAFYAPTQPPISPRSMPIFCLALLLCSAGLLPLCPSSYPTLLAFYAPTQPPISPRSMPIFRLALLLCSAGLLPLCPSSYPTGAALCGFMCGRRGGSGRKGEGGVGEEGGEGVEWGGVRWQGADLVQEWVARMWDDCEKKDRRGEGGRRNGETGMDVVCGKGGAEGRDKRKGKEVVAEAGIGRRREGVCWHEQHRHRTGSRHSGYRRSSSRSRRVTHFGDVVGGMSGRRVRGLCFVWPRSMGDMLASEREAVCGLLEGAARGWRGGESEEGVGEGSGEGEEGEEGLGRGSWGCVWCGRQGCDGLIGAVGELRRVLERVGRGKEERVGRGKEERVGRGKEERAQGWGAGEGGIRRGGRLLIGEEDEGKEEEEEEAKGTGGWGRESGKEKGRGVREEEKGVGGGEGGLAVASKRGIWNGRNGLLKCGEGGEECGREEGRDGKAAKGKGGSGRDGVAAAARGDDRGYRGERGLGGDGDGGSDESDGDDDGAIGFIPLSDARPQKVKAGAKNMDAGADGRVGAKGRSGFTPLIWVTKGGEEVKRQEAAGGMATGGGVGAAAAGGGAAAAAGAFAGAGAGVAGGAVAAAPVGDYAGAGVAGGGGAAAPVGDYAGAGVAGGGGAAAPVGDYAGAVNEWLEDEGSVGVSGAPLRGKAEEGVKEKEGLRVNESREGGAKGPETPAKQREGGTVVKGGVKEAERVSGLQVRVKAEPVEDVVMGGREGEVGRVGELGKVGTVADGGIQEIAGVKAEEREEGEVREGDMEEEEEEEEEEEGKEGKEGEGGEGNERGEGKGEEERERRKAGASMRKDNEEEEADSDSDDSDDSDGSDDGSDSEYKVEEEKDEDSDSDGDGDGDGDVVEVKKERVESGERIGAVGGGAVGGGVVRFGGVRTEERAGAGFGVGREGERGGALVGVWGAEERGLGRGVGGGGGGVGRGEGDERGTGAAELGTKGFDSGFAGRSEQRGGFGGGENEQNGGLGNEHEQRDKFDENTGEAVAEWLMGTMGMQERKARKIVERTRKDARMGGWELERWVAEAVDFAAAAEVHERMVEEEEEEEEREGEEQKQEEEEDEEEEGGGYGEDEGGKYGEGWGRVGGGVGSGVGGGVGGGGFRGGGFGVGGFRGGAGAYSGAAVRSSGCAAAAARGAAGAANGRAGGRAEGRGVGGWLNEDEDGASNFGLGGSGLTRPPTTSAVSRAPPHSPAPRAAPFRPSDQAGPSRVGCGDERWGNNAARGGGDGWGTKVGCGGERWGNNTARGGDEGWDSGVGCGGERWGNNTARGGGMGTVGAGGFGKGGVERQLARMLTQRDSVAGGLKEEGWEGGSWGGLGGGRGFGGGGLRGGRGGGVKGGAAAGQKRRASGGRGNVSKATGQKRRASGGLGNASKASVASGGLGNASKASVASGGLGNASKASVASGGLGNASKASVASGGLGNASKASVASGGLGNASKASVESGGLGNASKAKVKRPPLPAPSLVHSSRGVQAIHPTHPATPETPVRCDPTNFYPSHLLPSCPPFLPSPPASPAPPFLILLQKRNLPPAPNLKRNLPPAPNLVHSSRGMQAIHPTHPATPETPFRCNHTNFSRMCGFGGIPRIMPYQRNPADLKLAPRSIMIYVENIRDAEWGYMSNQLFSLPVEFVDSAHLGVCSRKRGYNLLWIERNRLAPLKVKQLEMLMGYPEGHVSVVTNNKTSRYKMLGNTFHVPTVALHLSVLRRLNRPIRVLSLFSGIGGALVALHMVKVPVICAVSVEFEKSCRDAEGRWWRETAMAEERAGRDGVNQMLGELLQLYHNYHGGPVIVGNPTVNVYHIYYGSWGSGSGKEVIDAFVQALSSDSGSQGSAADASVKGWWAISTAYYQSGSGGKKNVSSKVRLAGTVSDNYSRGKKTDRRRRDRRYVAAPSRPPIPFRVDSITLLSFCFEPTKKQLTGNDVPAIVKSKVGAGKPFALDPHGIYVLLTSSDVTLKGYCTEYCGWHTEDSINSSPLRYAFVGHRGQCPDACGVESTSPNGKPGIDATISTLAHELTEAATDPDANAGWFDDDGEENADKCSWEYGTTKTGYQQSGQSYKYNVVGLNGMKFLVQLNWDRVKSKCVLQSALPSAGGGGGGNSPPPPPPTGGSVKMRCDCNCASASNPMSCQCSCTKTG
ncbi:unnamed protein product [Closterium sp. NIES-64]|nr:unnamed protein product [Closterium sp. NIES-64]